MSKTLKIFLKAKDEPELIDKWIEHHLKICNTKDLAIMDCGSTDSTYIQKLSELSSIGIEIYNYPYFYNSMHGNACRNHSPFVEARSEYKYITILDADEFLIGYDPIKEVFSPYFINIYLNNLKAPIWPAGWIHNGPPPASFIENNSPKIDWSTPIEMKISDHDYMRGLINGKTIIKSEFIEKAKNLGHIYHVKDVVQLIDPDYIGKIFTFHMSNLPFTLLRRRVLRHLQQRKVISPLLQDENEIENFLTVLYEGNKLNGAEKIMAKRYLFPENTPNQNLCKMQLLSGLDIEALPEISSVVNNFDHLSFHRSMLNKFNL